jgi:hypothetical protein
MSCGSFRPWLATQASPHTSIVAPSSSIMLIAATFSGVSSSRSGNACLASVAAKLPCHVLRCCVRIGLRFALGLLQWEKRNPLFRWKSMSGGVYIGPSSLLILTCSVCGESRNSSTCMLFTAVLY